MREQPFPAEKVTQTIPTKQTRVVVDIIYPNGSILNTPPVSPVPFAEEEEDDEEEAPDENMDTVI